MFVVYVKAIIYLLLYNLHDCAFNISVKDDNLKGFCDNYGPKTLTRKPTCHKNSKNFTCMDLMRRKMPRTSQNTRVIETGLSDFHLMTLIAIRKEYRIFQSTILICR